MQQENTRQQCLGHLVSQAVTCYSLMCLCWLTCAILMMQGMLRAANQVTGTPAYMALELLEAGGREVSQTVSTELQSLMYCFIYSATRHKLHWAHRAKIDAVDMKALPFVSNRYFESKVLSRIPDVSLRSVAVKLRKLFDLGNSNRPQVSVQPIGCLRACQNINNKQLFNNKQISCICMCFTHTHTICAVECSSCRENRGAIL